MNRKLKFFLMSALGLLLLLCLAAVFLVRSETAGRYAVKMIADQACGSLKVGESRGSLWSGLTLGDIEYAFDGKNVQIGTADVDIALLPLLKGALHLKEIKVRGLAYRSEETVATVLKSGFAMLGACLPRRTVVVDTMALSDIVFNTGAFAQSIERLTLNLFSDESTLTVRHALLEGEHFQAVLQGDVALDAPHSFKSQVRWTIDRLQGGPLRGKFELHGDQDKVLYNHRLYEPWFLVSQGEFKITGAPDDNMRIGFEGELAGQDLPAMHVLATAVTNTNGVDFQRLEILSLGGLIKANGRLDWRPSPSWNLVLNGNNLQPAQHWPQWKGTLDFASRVTGRLIGGDPQLEISGLKITGRLLNQSFSASGGVSIKKRSATLTDFAVHSGENRLKMNGIASNRSDLRIDFDLPDPVHLWTGVNGHLKGRGTLKGDMRKPSGTLALEGRGMGYGEYRLAKAAGEITFDAHETPRSQGRFTLHGFSVDTYSFDDISVGWTGDFQDFNANLKVFSPKTRTDLAFKGACLGDNCRLKVEDASFALAAHGQWRLRDAVELDIAPDAIDPFDSCWVQGQAQDVCLNSAWRETDGWIVRGAADAPAFKAAIAMLGDVFDKTNLGWDKEKK